MRFNVAALPALTAGLLLVIATALDSEPPISNPGAEMRIEVPEVHTLTIPRVTADMEGDIAPMLFVTGRTFDFPAWEPAPEPTQAQVLVEPVRTPLPAISSVPQHCPQAFSDVFGANAPAWCAISRCESGWRLDAINVSGLDDSHGPLQINFYGALGPSRLVLIQSLGYQVATVDEAKALMRSDWHASLHVAYVLSSGGVDYSPWSCRRVLN